MDRPQTGDYAPYHDTYISKIGDGDIIEILTRQQAEINEFLRAIPQDKGLHSYGVGKWTVKQNIGHLIDTERIMAYRLLRFARNDNNELMGFEQDDYITHSRFNDMELNDLIDEFYYVRKANLYLFKSLSIEEKKRDGIASKNRVTVNALLYIIAGHAEHHMRILKERYL